MKRGPILQSPMPYSVTGQPLFLRLRSFFLGGLLLILAGGMIYYNALRGEFQFDDIHNIVQNPYVHIATLDMESISGVLNSPNQRRVLANLSFALNYYFGRYDVFGYHLVNLFVHIANAILVMLLATFILRRLAPNLQQRDIELLALFSAMVFLAHPIQVQAVTYIVQRMAAMATLFYCATLLFYILARHGRSTFARISYCAAAGLSMLCAFLSKENTFILPLTVIAFELAFFTSPGDLWRRNKSIVIAVISVAIVVAIIAIWWMLPGILAGFQSRDFTLAERLLTQPRVVFYYLSLLAWPLPARFCFDCGFITSTSLLAPATTLLAMVGLVLATIGAVIWRQRAPLYTFAVAWFLGNLIIESSIIPLEMVFDHRVYLPSIGLFVLGAYVLYRLVGGSIRLLLPLAIVVLVLLGSGAVERNYVWSSMETLLQDAARKGGQARVYNNLGWSYLQRDELTKAEQALLQAIKAGGDRDYGAPYNNLASVYLARNEFGKAIKYAGMALDISPNNAEWLTNLGIAQMNTGAVAEARMNFAAAIRNAPWFYLPRLTLGALHYRQGERQAALDMYKQALALDRGVAQIHVALSEYYLSENDLRQAAYFLEQAIALQKNAAEWHYMLGNIYVQLGDLDKAETLFLRETKVSGSSFAWNNLGNIAWMRGQLDEAVRFYKKALELDPANDLARENIRRINSTRM